MMKMSFGSDILLFCFYEWIAFGWLDPLSVKVFMNSESGVPRIFRP